MSSIYVTEPPTKGKVILKTSLGPLEIELWPKEAPMSCRNFVQLCLESYYDNTIFHRVLKDFILQGGDPTGTGEGGESIYGHPFKDEFHSRIRFRHRGMVAMANDGPNTNRSQFFITLNVADHLNFKNTIFGKIVGDSIFNALKVNDFEIENERPVYDIKLFSVDVVYNPFDDIIPRQKPKPVLEKPQPQNIVKPKRNLTLLSFGEEAQEDDQEQTESGLQPPKQKKIKSLHSVQNPAASVETVRSVLSKGQPAKEKENNDDQTKEPSDDNSDQDLDEADFERSMRKKVRDSLTAPQKTMTSLSEKQSSEREELSRKMAELKKELRKMKKTPKADEATKETTVVPEREKTEEEKALERQEQQKKEAKEFLENQKLKYSKKKAYSKKEKQQIALEKFLSFTKSLREQNDSEETEPSSPKQSPTKDSKDSKSAESEKGWFNHRLVFEKDPNEKIKNEDDYSVFDPLKGKKDDRGPQLSYHQKRLQRKTQEPGKW